MLYFNHMNLPSINMFYKRTVILILATVLSVIIYSLIFLELMREEGFSYTPVDAIYWIISTMTTVGFGDIVFRSQIGKIYAIFVELTGIALIFGVAVPYIIVPWMESKFHFKLPEEARSLENHIVICGFSEFIEEFLSELEYYNVEYVILEDNKEKVIELLNRRIKVVYTRFKEESFEKVNLDRARLLLCSFKDESKNADILLCVKDYTLPKVAIAEDPYHSKFLVYAGATKVLSIKGILGIHMARIALDAVRHEITSAIEIVKDIDVAEIFLTSRSKLVGRTLGESRIRNRTGCNVLGLWKDGEFIFNPSFDELMKGNSVLLAVGNKRQLKKLLNLAVGR